METKRRKLTKNEREFIYKKYDGHCAYCGCELRYQDMQVDHLIPLNGYFIQGKDVIENMMPSCRSCNNYKRSSQLEGFRMMLENMPHALMRDSVTYKNAVRYGLVIPNPHEVEFYFEKVMRLKEMGE